jgi:TonB family protein
MFESLTVQRRERRIAQPMLSFAIHASLIALVVGQGSARSHSGQEETMIHDGVIYVPDAGGTAPKVEPGPETPLPSRPICHCEAIVPGPITAIEGGEGTEAVPGLPVSNPIGRPGYPILLPGPDSVVGVYREGDLSDPPVVRHFPEPVYPPALRTARVEGVVQVTYVVDSLGRVEPGSITIVSTDHPSMAESVRSALVRARFQPGKVRGTPVRSLVRQTIRFSLMSL